MNNCELCNGENVHHTGTLGTLKHYQCKDCGAWFNARMTEEEIYALDDEWDEWYTRVYGD
jgi:transposase-like protein